jgi:hypothetical protein
MIVNNSRTFRKESPRSSLLTLVRGGGRKRLEKFLVRFVNATELPHLQAIERAFSDLMPQHAGGLIAGPLGLGVDSHFIDPRDEKERYIAVRNLVDFVNDLKIAWTCDTRLDRELAIASILVAYVHGPKGKFSSMVTITSTYSFIGHNDPIELDGFALVLLHALHFARNMRCCANPDCPARYYLAPRGKYCSKECAAPSQRAFKLAWWDRHKKEQLKNRRFKKKRRSTQKRGGK